MDYRNIDLFSPLLVVVVIFFYVLFAFIGAENHLRGLISVAPLTYIYILCGTLIFIVGYLVAKLVEKHIIEKNIGTRNASDIIRTFLDWIVRFPKFAPKGLIIWVCIPLIFQFINLLIIGGIPLFSGYMKASAFNSVTVASYLLFILTINALLAYYYKHKYFLLVIIGVILFTATGYRALLVGIILSVLITVFYTRAKRFKYFLVLVPVIILLGLLIGSIAASSIEWQHWNVNPMSLIFIRAGYTLNILDKIVFLHNPHPGLVIYSVLTGFFQSADPRLVLGQLVLHRVSSITATIFGPAILELGIIGLAIQMFFFGLVLELLHYLQNIKKGLYTVFYAVGLAHIIIWVETSPMDLAVWIYFIFAIIIITTAVMATYRKKSLQIS